MSSSSTRPRRGFTLLEVAIATMIVGLTLAAALAAISAERQLRVRLADAVVASTLADAKLTELSLEPIASRYRLPDSLARGAFRNAPGLTWRAKLKATRDDPRLYDLTVDIRRSDTTLATAAIRLFRPDPVFPR